MITRFAKMIFSAYRRDEFADPDGFVMQLGVVLEPYQDAVIQTVCDPRTGIQRRCKWPPSIAEMVEACEAEATSLETRRRYAAIPKPEMKRLAAPKITTPGRFANVLVHPGDPRYSALLARTKADDADPIDWKVDERGLHVNWLWLDRAASRKPLFQQFSGEDLRRMYPPRTENGSEQSHVKQETQDARGIHGEGPSASGEFGQDLR